MPEISAGLIDRLSLNPRPGRGAARLGFGVKALDQRLDGGLEQAGLHEIRTDAARDIAAATGTVLSLIARAAEGSTRKRVLWVTEPAAGAEAGVLFPDGIAQYGLDPDRITQVFPSDLKGALWAADEGAKCPDLLALVLHVRGNPRRLDRVATRRLLLRARESGVFLCLLRQGGVAEASAALTRWHVTARPCRPDRSYPRGVGLPRQALILEQSRSGQTGGWMLEWNPRTRSFANAPTPHAEPISVDRPAPSGHRPDRPRALGEVVDLRRSS